MDRAEIAGRINTLLKKYTNTATAKALGVTREAIRQWRKGTTWPRLDKINELADYCETSPEHILLGTTETLKVHQVRERICQDDSEFSLLAAFRKSNDAGRGHILALATAVSKEHPRAENVITLRRKKRKP